MAAPITVRRSVDAIHFTVDGIEFLELRRGGACIVRSVAPDGSPHEYIQNHPGLLAEIAAVSGEFFAVAVEPLPPMIAEHFVIPSVVALYLGNPMKIPLLIAREPLELFQLNLLRARLHPFVGVLNKDRLFVPRRESG